MREHRVVRESRETPSRLLGLTVAVTVLFFLLLMRLWYLQIVKAETFLNLSESNRLRLVPVAASRGTILDRNGVVLVDNSPSFSVAVLPQEVADKDALIEKLVGLIGADPADLREKWEKGRKRNRYQPVILASGITRDQLEILEENRSVPSGTRCGDAPDSGVSPRSPCIPPVRSLGRDVGTGIGKRPFQGIQPG